MTVPARRDQQIVYGVPVRTLLSARWTHAMRPAGSRVVNSAWVCSGPEYITAWRGSTRLESRSLLTLRHHRHTPKGVVAAAVGHGHPPRRRHGGSWRMATLKFVGELVAHRAYR